MSDDKFYSYNENHNPLIPADYWFQHPKEGLTLFIILYTQACRWNRCSGCNLPSQMSENHVSYIKIMSQIDFCFNHLLDNEKKQNLKKIILSNNGSILDEDTFSTTALLYFLARMNQHCPNISILTIETRPEYVDEAELEVISRAIHEGDTPTQLEIAIGFEAFDNTIRNEHFNKGLDLDKFEKLLTLLAKYDFKLKAYFMLKPVPEMNDTQAENDIIKGIDYLASCRDTYTVDISMHLNPTYVAGGTELETAFKNGEYTPPVLESVVPLAKHAAEKKLPIFLGLYDEGLAVEGGSFRRKEDKALVEKLEEFNRTNDPRCL